MLRESWPASSKEISLFFHDAYLIMSSDVIARRRALAFESVGRYTMAIGLDY